jgi:hypothetical protein
LLTPPTACESERGLPRDHQEFDLSNEVRVTLLVNEQDIIPQTRHQMRSPPSDDSRYDKSTVSPTTARAREALAIDQEVQDFLVDKELARVRLRRTSKVLDDRSASSSCRRREQEPSTAESRPSPRSRQSRVPRAVSARTRRCPRPRKS